MEPYIQRRRFLIIIKHRCSNSSEQRMFSNFLIIITFKISSYLKYTIPCQRIYTQWLYLFIMLCVYIFAVFARTVLQPCKKVSGFMNSRSFFWSIFYLDIKLYPKTKKTDESNQNLSDNKSDNKIPCVKSELFKINKHNTEVESFLLQRYNIFINRQNKH